MRPAKRILLAGNFEFRVGLLSYLLRTYHYAVTTADTAGEAEQLMLKTPASFDLLLVSWPLMGVAALLTRAKAISPCTRTLVVAQDDELEAPAWIADATISKFQYSSEAILDRVALLTARKRGPRRWTKVTPKTEATA